MDEQDYTAAAELYTGLLDSTDLLPVDAEREMAMVDAQLVPTLHRNLATRTDHVALDFLADPAAAEADGDCLLPALAVDGATVYGTVCVRPETDADRAYQAALRDGTEQEAALAADRAYEAHRDALAAGDYAAAVDPVTSTAAVRDDAVSDVVETFAQQAAALTTLPYDVVVDGATLDPGTAAYVEP